MSELFKRPVQATQVSDPTKDPVKHRYMIEAMKQELDRRLLEQAKEIGLRNSMKRK